MMSARCVLLLLLLIMVAPAPASADDARADAPLPAGTLLMGDMIMSEYSDRSSTPGAVKGSISVPLRKPGNSHNYGRREDEAAKTQSISLIPALPMNVPPLRRYAAGKDLFCGETLADPHRLLCWPGDSRKLAEVPLPAPLDDLVVGDHHGCALARGKVLCFGASACGAVGTKPAPAPETGEKGRPGLRRHQGCAGNGHGVSGDAADAGRIPPDSPVQVAGLPPVTAIAARGNASCAIADGRAYCWGLLGADPMAMHDSPPDMSAGPRFVRNFMKGGQALVDLRCSTTDSASLFCGGTPVPQRLGNIDLLQDIAIGHDWACARRVTGTIHCLPIVEDRPPQLAKLDRYGSTIVAGLSEAKSLALSAWTGCALDMTGTLGCWGIVPSDPNQRENQYDRPSTTYRDGWQPLYQWQAIETKPEYSYPYGHQIPRSKPSYVASILGSLTTIRGNGNGIVCAMSAARMIYCRDIMARSAVGFTILGPVPSARDWGLGPTGQIWLLTN